ncbi:hypothetical protein D9615_009088 [Tricholomella constricta]|uniref:Uncharacterized protein n=1 Tax=Tricholomella constricta TaxID=117010 RepID=A0A8H5LYR2_9AGAR|nr:hypothetical protein D9615_009088 [Tricholomella constricta]
MLLTLTQISIMSKTASSELSQVSALFNDCISIINGRPAGNLDGAAEAWLKDARLNIMRQVEKSYHKLAEGMNDPMRTPRWALDPSQRLNIYTKGHPYQLNAYANTFIQEFKNLMAECGFDAVVTCSTWTSNTVYRIAIKFPVAGAAALNGKRALSHSENRRFKKLPRFSANALRTSQVIEDSDAEMGAGDAASNGGAVASPTRRWTRSQSAKRQRTQDEAGHGEGSTGARRSKRLRGSTEDGKKKSRAKK